MDRNFACNCIRKEFLTPFWFARGYPCDAFDGADQQLASWRQLRDALMLQELRREDHSPQAVVAELGRFRQLGDVVAPFTAAESIIGADVRPDVVKPIGNFRCGRHVVSRVGAAHFIPYHWACNGPARELPLLQGSRVRVSARMMDVAR